MGATVSKNSHRLSRAAVSANSSRSVLSKNRYPESYQKKPVEGNPRAFNPRGSYIANPIGSHHGNVSFLQPPGAGSVESRHT